MICVCVQVRICWGVMGLGACGDQLLLGAGTAQGLWPGRQILSGPGINKEIRSTAGRFLSDAG